MSNQSSLVTVDMPTGSTYPLETGAGARLAAHLQRLLPAMLETVAPQLRAAHPMAGMLVSSAPMLLNQIRFSDAQAVQILESLDDLTSEAFREVLGTEG